MKNEIQQQTAAPATITARHYDNFISFIDRPGRTAQTYLTNLRQWAAWTAYSGIDTPTRADIIAYRDFLTGEHDALVWAPYSPQGWSYRTDRAGRPLRVTCTPNTVAQYLRTVCMFFRWTAAAGIYPNIADNIHAPKIRHDTHKKEALTPAAVVAIEDSIKSTAADLEAAAATHNKDRAGRVERATLQGKRLFAMYLLTVTAGLRCIELSRANVRDLETAAGVTYLFIQGKGHTEADQKKALAPEAAAAIRDYLNSRPDGGTGSAPLFAATGNRNGGGRIAPTTISRMLKKALQGAGYDSHRLTAHSLRHTAGTAVQNMTGDLYATQKYMRHSNPATTEIYLHCEDAQREAQTAAALYGYYHGRKTDPAAVDLSAILSGLTPAQRAQLASMAAATA